MLLVYPIIALLGFGQSSIMPLLTAVLLQSAPELRGRVMSLMSLDRVMMSVGGHHSRLLGCAGWASDSPDNMRLSLCRGRFWFLAI